MLLRGGQGDLCFTAAAGKRSGGRTQLWISACRLPVRTEPPALATLRPTPANVHMVSTDTTATKCVSPPTAAATENGGCEHFCREFPDRSYVCFCAPGYGLDQDNSTCLPQVRVPCGRPQIHFSPRVINGLVCPKGHCPWQAMLSENNVFKCGAIVLSEQWVLTAAHCVWRKPATIFNVTVGEHDRTVVEKTEQHRQVVKVFIHPGYNKTNSDKDLAVLKLHRPVKLGLYVVPICLPAQNSSISRTLANVRHSTVSGWGRLSRYGPPATILQRLMLPRVPLQECRLHSKLNITRNMLCAGLKTGGSDACEGDSGGPLVTRYKKTWFLTGVVSWGKGCANENLYGVYVRVSNFLDWIADIV
ncbi:unnamed protein product, partial [Tetraodon nigroviridis]